MLLVAQTSSLCDQAGSSVQRVSSTPGCAAREKRFYDTETARARDRPGVVGWRAVIQHRRQVSAELKADSTIS